MCRHLAYLGPPVALSALLFDPPHSLSHQSWAPRDMHGGGTINADGFGVGWHTPAGPVRYRRATPLWSDATLPALGVQWAVRPELHLYATAGRGFETPTLNELAYRPDGLTDRKSNV